MLRWHLVKKETLLHVPKLVTVGLLLLTVIPVHIPAVSSFVPMVEVMAIYYWCVYRPLVIPVWFAAALGLGQDVIYGSFLGLTMLTNLLTRIGVVGQRKFFVNKPFYIVWGGFALVALAVALLKWILFMLLSWSWIWSGGGVMQWLVSVTLYPAVHWLFNRLFRLLPPAIRHAQ